MQSNKTEEVKQGRSALSYCVIVAIALVCISFSSSNDFEAIDKGEGDIFISPKSLKIIETDKQIITVEQLVNHKDAQLAENGKKYRSERLLTQIDCKNRRFQILGAQKMEQESGKGVIIFQDTNHQAEQDVSSHRSFEVVTDYACGKAFDRFYYFTNSVKNFFSL